MQPKKKMMIVGSHTITEPDHRVKMMISRLCSEGWHIQVGDHSGMYMAQQENLRDMNTDWLRVYTARPQPQRKRAPTPTRTHT